MSEPTKRYFEISTAGPDYTVCATSPGRAMVAWAEWQITAGYENEMGDDDNPLPDSITEVSAERVAARTFDDDGTRRPLTDLALGGVLCTEY